MSVAIIDCGSGNLRSAAKAFEKMAGKLTGQVYVTTVSYTHLTLPTKRIV